MGLIDCMTARQYNFLRNVRRLTPWKGRADFREDRMDRRGNIVTAGMATSNEDIRQTRRNTPP
jgi:hypothetical protein